ncbi:hypothetical protein LUD75_07620 [Epilithonimonas sp. JDS]|uniref:hypothetical protein n=1 Tax=Epilithonimonas sp. JDS TaxID=2902797 RepID=UPI001E3CB6D0|nr:hypothetical protein [Epilithonimonas sp. JDS]MCD9854570.1 hypothetical protein [Epilithonimonas sp. JDS]
MKKINLVTVLSLSLLSCTQKEGTNFNETNIIHDSTSSVNNYENVTPQETEEEKKIRKNNEEKLRKEKEAEQLYGNNSLETGATPYSKYYGDNSDCEDRGCSKINVTASNSDVLVTIKKNDEVVRHAYIQAGDSYTFSFPNGTYQAFFYYGKGWNPNKVMKNGELEGGFVSNEEVGKDDPQSLFNNILEYELVLQQNGNFSTRPSNIEEAL